MYMHYPAADSASHIHVHTYIHVHVYIYNLFISSCLIQIYDQKQGSVFLSFEHCDACKIHVGGGLAGAGSCTSIHLHMNSELLDTNSLFKAVAAINQPYPR